MGNCDCIPIRKFLDEKLQETGRQGTPKRIRRREADDDPCYDRCTRKQKSCEEDVWSISKKGLPEGDGDGEEFPKRTDTDLDKNSEDYEKRLEKEMLLEEDDDSGYDNIKLMQKCDENEWSMRAPYFEPFLANPQIRPPFLKRAKTCYIYTYTVINIITECGPPATSHTSFCFYKKCMPYKCCFLDKKDFGANELEDKYFQRDAYD